jgi:hypothetical protein
MTKIFSVERKRLIFESLERILIFFSKKKVDEGK